MADRDIVRRARTLIKELRGAELRGTRDQPSDDSSDLSSLCDPMPLFLRDRAASSAPTPSAGELWMAFPKGGGLPTPVALLRAAPLLVIPMTREVWLADERDPLLPPETSPTGEWLAALLPGVATVSPGALRRPVGGLPVSLISLLRRLVEGPALARQPTGHVPIDSDGDVPLPSHATEWASEGGAQAPWLAGAPLTADDPRTEARRLYLEAISWLSTENLAPVPSILDRLRAALAEWTDAILEPEWASLHEWAQPAHLGMRRVHRSAAVASRSEPVAGVCQLGSVRVELTFEPDDARLRVTLVATRDERPEAGVLLAVKRSRMGGIDEPIVRVTGEEGLIAGLILSTEEGVAHELAVEADGHRRVLSF